MSSGHLLRAEGLEKKYHGRRVVRDVSLEVGSGEVVGLLGPNGAGKTTTFYIMSGMIRPEKGAIIIDNTDISGLPMYERSLRGISYLPQEPSIFRKLTVRDNLRAVLEIRGEPPDVIEAESDRLVSEYDLEDFASREGSKLSGGQRRRAEIARCIATTPKFILFDEPFAGIDPIAIKDLKTMLGYLKEKGMGILITDHNVRETLSITDRAYILSEGSILESGPPGRIVENDKVKDIYLGKDFSL
jgi:lipopolysaccharide export system ATP-binding protein